MKEYFHERLKRLREAKSWSRSHLAKKSRLDKELLGALETDVRQVPSWFAVSKLASALGTNPLYLATGEGDDKPMHVSSRLRSAETLWFS